MVGPQPSLIHLSLVRSPGTSGMLGVLYLELRIHLLVLSTSSSFKLPVAGFHGATTVTSNCSIARYKCQSGVNMVLTTQSIVAP